MFAGLDGEDSAFLFAVVEESGDDRGGEEFFELAGVAAEGDDLFDEGGGGEAELFAGHDEDGFDGGDFSVGECDAELVVEVGHISEAAEDSGGFSAFDELDGEAFVSLNGDIGEAFGELAQEGEAFVEGEEVFFFGVDADGDDESVEELSAAVNDVDMAKGRGVESAGEDGDFGRRSGQRNLAEEK